MKKQWFVISGMVVLFTMLLAACNSQPATDGTNLSVTDTPSALLSSELPATVQSEDISHPSEQKSSQASAPSAGASVARSETASSYHSSPRSQTTNHISRQTTTSSPQSAADNNSYLWSTQSTWSNDDWALSIQKSATLIVGGRKTLTARVYPPYKYENQQIKAEISDPAIIKVTKEFKNNSMEIEGLAVGECYVHFTAPNGLKASTWVRVVELPSSASSAKNG